MKRQNSRAPKRETLAQIDSDSRSRPPQLVGTTEVNARARTRCEKSVNLLLEGVGKLPDH